MFINVCILSLYVSFKSDTQLILLRIPFSTVSLGTIFLGKYCTHPSGSDSNFSVAFLWISAIFWTCCGCLSMKLCDTATTQHGWLLNILLESSINVWLFKLVAID